MAKHFGDLDIIEPLGSSDPRKITGQVQKALRELILSARLEPGTILSQVQLAKRFNVSRTPVREALRMLQAEGLVSGETNKRCSVIGFTPELVDGIYAERLVVEALAGAITSRKFATADIDQIFKLLDDMKSNEAHSNFELWRVPHTAFHQMLSKGAPDSIRDTATEKMVQSQRFRALLQARFVPGWWRRGEIEHARIAEAFARNDPAAAASEIARHLSRSGLELLSEYAPHYDPISIRSALLMLDANPSGDDMA